MTIGLLRKLLSVALVLTFLTASDCFPTDDDDDVTDDDDVVADDDDAADDDDFTPPPETMISGEVIAIDRATGVVLSPEEYTDRAGGIILYVLPDAQDLSNILDKVTMVGPGPYEVSLTGYVGPVDVVAVADEDRNHFIDSDDTVREYAFNPLAAAGSPVEGVDVYVDLAPDWHGDDDDDDNGGGWCGGDTTELSGDVNIDEELVANPGNQVAVSTNAPDLSTGPWHWMTRIGAGPWALDACDWWGQTALLGYLDDDGNSYFEPSDPIGDAPGNPFTLGIAAAGIQIEIPSLVDVAIPVPPTYVALAGTVTYGGFTTGDILVFANHITTDGQLFSSATLAAPGAFSVIAPANTADVLVWAVLDSDGDGVYDTWLDPFASEGPMNTGLGASGIVLDLGDAEPGTFAGTVFWDGPVASIDEMHLGVFDTPVYDPADGMPVDFVVVPNPAFPYEFEFPEIEAGTYWIGAYLDVGGDDPSGAGPEDPTANVGPLLLPPGGDIDGVEVVLTP